MNAIDLFVREDEPHVSIANFLDHVDHVVGVAGIEHVGIGFDMCDSFKNYLNMKRPLETRDVIGSHANLGEFTAGLIERGYTDDQIMAVLGGNFKRVFEEILP